MKNEYPIFHIGWKIQIPCIILFCVLFEQFEQWAQPYLYWIFMKGWMMPEQMTCVCYFFGMCITSLLMVWVVPHIPMFQRYDCRRMLLTFQEAESAEAKNSNIRAEYCFRKNLLVNTCLTLTTFLPLLFSTREQNVARAQLFLSKESSSGLWFLVTLVMVDMCVSLVHIFSHRTSLRFFNASHKEHHRWMVPDHFFSVQGSDFFDAFGAVFCFTLCIHLMRLSSFSCLACAFALGMLNAHSHSCINIPLWEWVLPYTDNFALRHFLHHYDYTVNYWTLNYLPDKWFGTFALKRRHVKTI